MWIVIGHAIVAARKRADQIGGGKAFGVILEQQGISQVVPSATATRLIAIIERLAEVQAWHASLTDDRKFAWAAPSSIYQHCLVFNELKRETKRKKKTQPAMAPSSKHNARFIEQQEERIQELQEESHPNWVADYKDRSREERAEALCELLEEWGISLYLLQSTYKNRRQGKKDSRDTEDRAVELIESSQQQEE
jgi:hypothetical protein